MLESTRRPLTAPERRLLRAKATSFTARRRQESARSPLVTAAIAGALWLWTILASDASWLVITAFWVAAWIILTVWLRWDQQRSSNPMQTMAHALESALKRNEADVFDVRAHAFAEFEEIEDEGACYAFEIPDHRIVFISGQQFYPEARFPSLDFSLVYVLDESGRTVDMLIEKRGPRAAPTRIIPASIKKRLEVPEHLETRAGGIDDFVPK